MKQDNEALLELFGLGKKDKPSSEADKIDQKLKETLPTYDPKVGANGQGIFVKDSKEVSKRLQGALGMIVGQNTVNSMANRAIKTFHIIASDDIDPVNLVMFKSYLEEQYANVIQLLVSNSIIDLTKFDMDNKDANIALQAVEKLSGVDFYTKQRLARSAMNGNLTADEIGKNNALFQLLRMQEGKEYISGNPILDALMEGAVVLPPDQVNNFIENYTLLNEGTEHLDHMKDELKSLITQINDESDATKKKELQKQYNDKLTEFNLMRKQHEESRDKSWDNKRVNGEISKFYSTGGKADTDSMLYRVLAGGDARLGNTVVNDELSKAGIKTIGDLLARPENKYIRDCYEKALYLLATSRISGDEFISYSIDRVGIPLDWGIRATIIKKYPVDQVRLKGGDGKSLKGDIRHDGSKFERTKLGSDEQLIYDRLSNRQSISPEALNIYKRITNTKIKEAVALLLGMTGGSAIGAAGGAIAAAAGVGVMTTPWIAVPILAAAGAGALIAHFINKRKITKTQNYSARIEGWERVEQLINELNDNYLEVSQKQRSFEFVKQSFINNGKLDVTNDEINNAIRDEQSVYKNFHNKLSTVYEGVDIAAKLNPDAFEALFETTSPKVEPKSYVISEKARLLNATELQEALSYPDSLEDLEMINEARTIVLSNKPNQTIRKIKIGKDGTVRGADGSITNIVNDVYGMRDLKAYGSVEYDRKLIKDRRYNEPLFMTIRFKERYSDGSFGDNELCATIGIQGILNIVPSEEMEYVLKANAGVADEDVVLSDESDSKNQIEAIFKSFRNSSFSKKMPTSGKLFADLSNLTSLAIANKLTGKDSSALANANIIFSQKEADRIKDNLGYNYLKDMKLVSKLMKKYSVSTVMFCNDVSERAYICDNFEKVSFDVVPYSALRSKSSADQTLSTLNTLSRLTMK